MKKPVFFKRKPAPESPALLQTGRTVTHPFSVLDRYVPLGKGEAALYDAIREAVPLVDAAIGKIVALTGGFTLACDDPVLQTALNDFALAVPVSGGGYGLDTFIRRYLDQLLTYGTAVGEVLPTADGGGVHSLHNVPLQGLEILRDPLHGAGQVCLQTPNGPVPAPYPELLVYSALDPKPGQVTGNSLLKGLPFVTGILLKIYNTIGVNFERLGNLRFAVTYRPTGDAADRGPAKDRAMQIAQAWRAAMRDDRSGRVSDFIAVGDVDIKVIGADNQALDTQVPVRQMLEQIVAKTGLPPFILGLSWSTSERMAAQQTDMLTTELWNYRRQLTPVIQKIAGLWLRLQGANLPCRVVWDDISLQDEVATANAAYLRMKTNLLEQQWKEQRA